MDWGHLLETVSKLLTDLAIVFGGGWVLYNYLARKNSQVPPTAAYLWREIDPG